MKQTSGSGNSKGAKQTTPASLPGLVTIKISNLRNGKHDYRFLLRVSEFEDPALSAELFVDEIEVRVSLSKTPDVIFAEVRTVTHASLPCNRCLSSIQRPLIGTSSVAFLLHAEARLTKEDEAMNDEIRVLKKNDSQIDLTADVRETLLLSLPMRTVCERVLREDFDADHPECIHATMFVIDECRYDDIVVLKSSPEVSLETETEETEWQKALKRFKSQ